MFLSLASKVRFAVVLLLLICVAGAHGVVRKKRVVHHPKHRRHVMHNGNAVERRSNGRISDVHHEGRHMDIHHGLNGERRVSVERADHSRVVAERGRGGYVERRYSYREHEFYRRTYYYHGRAYDHFYRGFYFHGVGLHVYAPARFYPVGFYGWAYHPWRTRVVYGWGWGGAPWYGHYGFYFRPYASYPSASYWITDRMMAAQLNAAYEAGREDGAGGAAGPVANAGAGPANGPADGPMLSDQVKDLIANEVQNEINLENAEADLIAQGKEPDPASSGIARLLGDGQPHVFVVGAPLEVVNEANDEDCSLSEGDVLQLNEAPPADEKAAALTVLASKGGAECGKSAEVTVALDDLQEMQNAMRVEIDNGLDELQQKQGTAGLPALPKTAVGEATVPAFAPIAPPPDPNGAEEVDQALKDGDAAEHEVTTQEKQEEAKPGPK